MFNKFLSSAAASVLAIVPLGSLAEVQIDLANIDVTVSRISLIGIADSASQGLIEPERIANTPLAQPGDLLETIPGLIVTQHSGTGKANQYFLRGFNLDHGTDFSVWLEGMPINMPTHGHGQGYADVNFLIPELISNVEYLKGPYYADQGDFSAAGASHVRYARTLPYSIAHIGVGQDGFKRILLASTPVTDGVKFTYALEGQVYDGPWEVEENLEKLNGLARWSDGTDENGWDILAMAYRSRWVATDQVPNRAVRSGLIGRFDSLDDTDGGNTHRYSLSIDWRAWSWKANAYFIDYQLDLLSNFTYFLDDPINGDQFKQFDKRRVYGGAVSRHFETVVDNRLLSLDVGFQTRFDQIDKVGLYRAVAGKKTGTIREDSVDQISAGLWFLGRWQITERLNLSGGLRADYYNFAIDSNNSLNSGHSSDQILSPKLNLTWRAYSDTDFYFNWGKGFHSNDARGTTISVNPSDGTPAQKVDALVRATGQEIGLRAQWTPNWHTTFAIFKLDIDSELLFIGDAGLTEASRPSRRVGIEWTNHYRPFDRLYLDADFALTRARFNDSNPAGSYIPGAVGSALSIGARVERELGWFGSMHLSHFSKRPLVEDNSIRSQSSTLVNAKLGYRHSKRIIFSLDIFNLFNRKVSDIEYLYESRLNDEPEPVLDVHSHPALPRTLRATMQLFY